MRFITKRWPHHSTHSGYDRLIEYLGTAMKPVDLDRLSSRWIPERIASRFARRAGVRGYFTPSFYAELAAAREMLVRPRRTVYHVLYGDDTYRYLGLMRRIRGHPLVVSYHLPPAVLEEELRHAEHLERADAIVVVGMNQVPFFNARCAEDRVHYVPHGVDTDVFCPHSTPDDSPRDPRPVLFVGKHRRDFATLSEVIDRMERVAPEVRFVLLTRSEVRDMFGGRRNVVMRERVSEPELIELYRASALLLQPMEESTANNSILEALACGTPVVATDIGGVRDYVGTGGAAILTPPGDPDSMVDALIAIARDEDARLRMGEAARQQALRFSWPKVAATLSRLYRNLS